MSEEEGSFDICKVCGWEDDGLSDYSNNVNGMTLNEAKMRWSASRKQVYECPCCRNKTLSQIDFYEICSVCGWEDDPGQHEHPDDAIGANKISLNRAHAAWKAGKPVK